MSTQLPAGKPIHLTAKVTNAEGAAVPDSLTWSATAGTIVNVSEDTLAADLSSAPVGTLTVSVSDGTLTASLDIEVTDSTPAAIELDATV